MPSDSSSDSTNAPPSVGPWLQPLLDAHAAEIEARSLLVRLDLDPTWHPPLDEPLEAALRVLLRLVFATVPDGCPVDLSGGRSGARVGPLEDGDWTARWQVAGDARSNDAPPRSIDSPIPLHPRTGDGGFHLRGKLAGEVRSAFAAAGWRFELSSVEAGRELLARATHG